MLSAKIILVGMTALPLVTLFASMCKGPLCDLPDDPVTTLPESAIDPGGSFFRAAMNAVPDAANKDLRGKLTCVRSCEQYSNTASCPNSNARDVVNADECEVFAAAHVAVNEKKADVLWKTRKNPFYYMKRIPGCYVWKQHADPVVELTYWNENTAGRGNADNNDFWQVCWCEGDTAAHADDVNFPATSNLDCPVATAVQAEEVQCQPGMCCWDECGLCYNTDGNQFEFGGDKSVKCTDNGEGGKLDRQSYSACKALTDANTGECEFIPGANCNSNCTS